MILISKTDLASPEELDRLQGVLRSLNTEAQIIPIRNGKVPLESGA
ncbi:MAG: hypothetical protein WD623_00060 [Marinobacter sp.]